ncbi:MAG TPA: VWA domain-containing protein [Acidobacteriaceae bacterium]|nr:VWA domain-containing protein [Acidobacteriaceae bacterium]
MACAAMGGAQQVNAGQQPATPPPGQQVPLFRTNANLVLVDVVVRDHGKPVHGLKQADFHVLENGKLQQVTIFEEHKATDALEVAQPAPLPPGMVSNDPRYTLTSAANVVLLDALNTPYSDQLYVRHRMLQFLQSIPPGTRVAVFTLASRLRMVEGFDAGPDVLEKALKEVESNPQTSPIMDPYYDEAMADLANMEMSAIGGAASSLQQFQQDQQKFQLDMRANMTIDALQQLGRYLSTIPGRKNLIWFSGAFPAIVAGGGQMGQVSEESDYDQQVKQMNALLTLARVAVYPVDARGLAQSDTFTAEKNLRNPRLFDSITVGPGAGVGVGGQPTVAQTVDAQNQAYLAKNAAEQNLMREVAQDTGGKAYLNTNALGEALGDAIANGSSYYTLGYVPENRNTDDSYRTITVQVPEAHYDLEYRRGYYALTGKHQDKLIPGKVNPLIVAMQRGTPELSQVLFRARAVPAGDAAVKTVAATAGPAGAMATQLKNPRRVMVDYWINPETLEIASLPDGRRQTRVELTEVVYNREGVRQNYNDTGLEVDLSGTGSLRPIHLQQQIDAPEGQMFLRLGVLDMNSRRIGTVEMPLASAVVH